MENILSAVQVLLSVVVIFLVLMHSGKDAGLSGAFGVGTGAGPFGGGALVERNLNRWTIGISLLWVANTIVLLKLKRRSSRHGPAHRVAAVTRKPPARSAGHSTPCAKRRP